MNPYLSSVGLLCLSNLFMTSAVYYLKEPLKLDYLRPGPCILGAIYFVFRGEMGG